MTYVALILAAACLTLGLLLVCALVGYSEVVEELRTRLDRAEAENEDLTNELRHQARGNHPAGRALREAAEAARGMHDPPAPDCVEWADWLDARADNVHALREALTERDAEHEGGGGA